MKRSLKPLLIGAAWFFGAAIASHVASIVLGSSAIGAVVLQALAVELITARAGVKWDPEVEEPPLNRWLSGLGRGLGAAAAVCVIAMGIAVIAGWARIELAPPNASLSLGALRAIAMAVRDPILYVALPLVVLGKAGLPQRFAIGFAALAGAAALLLHPAATPANVALAAALTGATGAAWYRTGAAWVPLGFYGGWSLFAGAVLRGGLANIAWTKGSIGPGLAADGAPAWVAVALMVFAGALWLRWPRKARGAETGATEASPRSEPR